FFTAHSLTATSVNLIATHHKGSASSLYLAAYYVGVSMGSTALAPIWEWKNWQGIIVIAAILPFSYMVFQLFISNLIKKRGGGWFVNRIIYLGWVKMIRASLRR